MRSAITCCVVVLVAALNMFADEGIANRRVAVVNHLEKALPDYAPKVVTDPRFVFDGSLIPGKRKPGEIPNPKARKPKTPPRPNYDYVFTEWSKTRGPEFIKENEAAFAYEEEHFHVPREFVSAILDIETQWGVKLGPRLVTTTLYTRAVYWKYPKKRKWAENELVTFLKLCERNDWDPFSIKGSPTGAFGYPQFEPSSYPALAVGYRKHPGPPDLFDSADAIVSVGNFLYKAGWGKTEKSRKKALHAYIKDKVYADAVLDYADFLLGNPPHHRYHFTVPPTTERAAIK
jgi:membrane-bound lytic murein transglycosylase B